MGIKRIGLRRIGIQTPTSTGHGGGGTDWSTYWTTRGVTPGADATLITTEINAALEIYHHVKITEPGIYDIDGTIYIPSNRTLEFVAGCTLRKKTGSAFYYVIANKGIKTLTPNVNITLIGNGIDVDINGIDNVGAVVDGLRGQVQFYRVTGLNVTGIFTDTIGAVQYFIHLAETSNVLMRDIDVEGDKDGIHISVGHDIVLEDLRTATLDDGIALDSRGYYNTCTTIGDVYNVTIRRWTDDYYASQGGSGLLLLNGSWEEWGSGVDYIGSDIVVNAGNVYMATSDGTSSVAPTHTSGTVTGADDIGWKWMAVGTFEHTDIYNVILEDCAWESGRSFIRTAGSAIAAPMITYFPGTGYKAIIDDVVISNLTIAPHTTGLSIFLADANLGTIEFKDSEFTIPATDYVFRIVPREETFTIDNIIFNNCILDLEGLRKPVTMPAPTYDYTINKITVTGGSDIRTDDAERTSLFGVPAVDILGEISLDNSVFHHLLSVFQALDSDGVEVTINADGCTFDETCARMVLLIGALNATVNFNATNCYFEETSSEMFRNDSATSDIIVVSTGSTGESIPALVSGTVDVTDSDLVLALGDNVVRNGKFRENVTGWSAVTGAIVWEADGSCKFTASGAGAAGINATVVNPLSDKIRVTFRAKSPTLTVVMRSPYHPNTLTPVTNPAMTTEWQTYVFEGARGAATGLCYILSNTNLSNGDIIYFDDITVVQYV